MSWYRKVLAWSLAFILFIPEAITLDFYIHGNRRSPNLLNWTRIQIWADR